MRSTEKGEEMQRDVIVACDFDSREEVLEFLELFEDKKPFVKIGMELFYSLGPDIVGEIKARGNKVFLDLKLHDIPNTVKKTMAVMRNLNVDMCNVHAAGTINMMKAALEGLSVEGARRTLLIAVTQLTSTDEETMQTELLIKSKLNETILRYGENALKAGLDGVVCSPLEAGYVKKYCGQQFLTVTPGVRFTDGVIDDQKRVTTPERARLLGTDYIVMGRPITQASDPKAAYIRACREFIGEQYMKGSYECQRK